MTKISKKKVFAISGSSRRNSTNENILKYIAKKFSDKIELEIFEGINKLPHFNPDLDNENPPQIINDFRNKVIKSDAIIFCTPEYVFSLPGSLKNVIDWNVSTTIFSKKPIGIIITAASGEKALESLSLIMKTIEAKISDKTNLVIGGAKGKITPNGEIIDQEIKDKIEYFIIYLIESIKK